ncbi:MAG: protein kinase domain-containing protein [Phycisphaerales bacterium]
MSGRAETIFEAMLDLSAGERPGALAGACGEDLVLLEDVRSLLEAHDRAEGFLSSPTRLLLDDRAGACGSGAGAEGPGSVIGRYRLLEQIGEGGFGVVFMADQEEPIRRRVALKIIKLGMDTKQVIARFEAERQALAMMDHPNIAMVFDAGTTDAGRPYFVMELVHGLPITDYCDRERLTLRERLSLVMDVCAAVQHAHHKGIIHRDLKPSNVLVTVRDGKAIPKVIDFGISKAVNQRLTERTLFTEFRQFVGTPEYMSPEQADMPGLDVDTRTDVYSLGVVLYELLTGMTPFDGAALRSRGFAELQRIIREDDPPTPSRRFMSLGAEQRSIADLRRADVGALAAGLRGELEWIVMKCLDKERARRYDTPNSLAEDLSRFLSDEPVRAGAPGAAYVLSKFVRRNRRGVAVALSLLVVLILGLAATSAALSWALRERRAAREAEAASRQIETFAVRFASAWINPLGEADTILWRKAQSAVLADAESLIEAMRARRDGDSANIARLQALVIMARWGEEFLLVADQSRSRLGLRLEPDSPDRPKVRATLGEIEKFIALAASSLPADDPIFGGLQNARTQARLLLSKTRAEDAEAYEDLIPSLERSLGRDSPKVLSLMLEEIMFRILARQSAAALSRLDDYARRRAEGAVQPSRTLEQYQELVAGALMDAKLGGEAAARFMEQCYFADLTALFEPRSNEWHIGMRTYGRWLWDQRDFARAEGVYADLCRQLERTPWDGDPVLPLVARFRLGACRFTLGDFAGAETPLRNSVAAASKHNGENHFYTNRDRAWLGAALAELGEFEEAEQLLLRAQKSFASIFPPIGVDSGEWISERQDNPSRLVRMYERWGKAEQAEEWRARLHR